MAQHYDGQFIHVVEATTPSRARASLGPSSYSELPDTLGAFVVLEACRTYPDPMHLVKVIWSGDDAQRANVIARGSAMTYGATCLEIPIHDAATCQHEDCRWARKSDRERAELEAFGRDADRIDASPGRYW